MVLGVWFVDCWAWCSCGFWFVLLVSWVFCVDVVFRACCGAVCVI